MRLAWMMPLVLTAGLVHGNELPTPPPLPAQALPAAVPQAPPLPAPALPAVPAAPPTVAAAPCPCPPATVTVCVPEIEKVTHTHPAYRCKCHTICLTCCPFKKGDCAGEPCASECGKPCGKPRQVRVLIKRFVKEEKCELHCKPREVPACPAGCPVP